MKAGESLFLEAGLALVFVLAPAAFGGVHGWAFTAAGAWLFLLLFLFPDASLEIERLPPFFVLGMFLLFAWILVQGLFFSLQRYATGMEILKWLSAAAGFVLIQHLPKASLYRLAFLLVLTSFLISLYGLIQTLSGAEKVLWQAKEFHRGFVTGTYMNRNHFAGFVELALGIAVGFLFSALRERRFVRVFFSAGIVWVIIAALFLSGSRGGLASFMISLALFSVLLARAGKRQSIRGLFFLLLLFGLAAFLLAGQPWFGRLTGESGYELAHGRPVVWENTLRLIQNHGWKGTGLGGFAWVFPQFQSERLQVFWDHAHNDYLELAAELGLPAFFLALSCFGILGWRVIRSLHRLGTRPFRLVGGIFVSLTSFAIHGLSDFNFAIPANRLLFIFLFSMMFRMIRQEEAPA